LDCSDTKRFEHPIGCTIRHDENRNSGHSAACELAVRWRDWKIVMTKRVCHTTPCCGKPGAVHEIIGIANDKKIGYHRKRRISDSCSQFLLELIFPSDWKNLHIRSTDVFEDRPKKLLLISTFAEK
jgi:hypothetical protein